MIVNFSQRSTGIEIMDDLDCRGEVVDQTLRELDFINHWLGGNAVTLNALHSLWKATSKNHKISIADLGCGSGEMLRLIAKRAANEGRQVELIGMDANPNITSFAQRHTAGFENILIETTNIFSEEFGKRKFDIVLSTLFLHHFNEDELISIFSSLKTQATHGAIINDIHRHPIAYYLIKWLTQLFSKSAMVKFDAPLSVLRAFNRNELENILAQAGIKNYQLKWKWAFRWQLIIFLSY
ncbi:MAG: methyltransferase domain-containing protein [Cyclobacteriaceae bacterium]|nr:methyltransferase domain-containing protein [Cyclobacteriaceae bacterium]